MKQIIYIVLLLIIQLNYILSSSDISLGVSPNFDKTYDNGSGLLNENDWFKLLEYSSNKKVVFELFDGFNYDYLNNLELIIKEFKDNNVESIDFSFTFCLNSKYDYSNVIKTFSTITRKNKIYPENVWLNIESSHRDCYNNSNYLFNKINNQYQEYLVLSKQIIKSFLENGYNIGIKTSKDTYAKVFNNRKDKLFSTLPLFYIATVDENKSDLYKDYKSSPLGSWTDYYLKQFKNLKNFEKISNPSIEIYLNTHSDNGDDQVSFGLGSGSGGSGSGSGSGNSGTSGAQLTGTGALISELDQLNLFNNIN